MRASFSSLETPVGRGLVAWTSRGVVALDAFVTGTTPGPASTARFLETVLEIAGEPAGKAPLPSSLRAEIGAVMRGGTHAAPVDLRPFEPLRQSVYGAVMNVPFGTVVSYADIARDIGRPRAWRAVGSALRRCPIDFLIPCHRVVHSGGRIAGPTAASIAWKRAMLELEGVRLP